MDTAYKYPLLQKITKAFSGVSKGSLQNTYIWSCQHILEPQEKMYELIAEFGIPTENVHILGKVYSTNVEVLGELQKAEFKAIQPEFDLTRTFDEQHIENCSSLFKSFLETSKTGDTIIVLDDGAELINIFNSSIDKIKSGIKIVGIEQTSSGFRKLEKMELKFPVINVARSGIKLNKESPLIAQLGCDRIKDVIKKYEILNPSILVVGLGPMGSNTLSILKKDGYFVIGHDTVFDSTANISDLIIKNNINILIGATGSNILSELQISELEKNINTNLYLISMSSADREFPASYMRKFGKLDVNIHGDSVWKKMILINNGFPITFKGRRYESTPQEIEKTVALLYGSVLYAISEPVHGSGLIDVPEKIEDIIKDNESN